MNIPYVEDDETVREYAPGEIVGDLTDAFESAFRSDFDIFAHFADADDTAREAIIRMELVAYETWLRDGFEEAKGDNDE